MSGDYSMRRRVRRTFAPSVDDDYQLAREEEGSEALAARQQRRDHIFAQTKQEAAE